MQGRIRNRQFRTPEVFILHIAGATVTTTSSRTGLTVGKYVAKVKKGAGADSNLVTITLNKPCGTTPQVKIQPITLDCSARLEAAPTTSVIQIRTLEVDGVTKEDDVDMFVFLFTNELGESAEGRHLS